MKYGEVTANFHLNEPADEDKVLINDLNENARTIDVVLQELRTILFTKAGITNPTFQGIPIAPDINNPNTNSQIATLNSMISMLNVKNILLYDSKNNFPDIGDENNLYILKNENNYLEYTWNGSKYIQMHY